MKSAATQGMKRAVVLALGSVLLSASALKTQDADEPIKNVISLIQDLDTKVLQSSKTEKETFAKYKALTGKTTASLKRSLQDLESKMSQMGLQAEAKQKSSEVAAREIQEIDAEVVELTASSRSAAESRQEAAELYNKTVADLNSTIDALEGAISAFKKAPADQTTVASLLELPLVLESISENDEVLLLRMAEKAPKDAPASESKTGSVVDLLSKLLRDFKDEKAAAELAEVKADSEYNLMKTAREKSSTSALASKEKKEQAKADTDGIFVSLSAALKSSKEDMAADTSRLKEITTDSKLETDEFKEREEMRLKERKALADSIDILRQVAGISADAPSTASMGLVQFRGTVQTPSVGPAGVLEKRHLVAVKLRSQALLTKSKELEELAEKFEENLDSVPVGKQIDAALQKQAWRLKDDQLRDDKDKAWCDLEISKTKTDIKHKSDETSSLEDRITSAKADVVALVGDIQAARTASAEVKQEMHEATLLREEAKHENQLAIQDSKDAQHALTKAMATLQNFYQSASLLQKSKKGLAISNQSYSVSGSSSVIKALEESSANFGRMEVDTQAQETADQAQFDAQMKEGNIQLARFRTDIELKEQEKTRLTEKAHSYSASWKLADRQQASITNYLNTVEEKCNTDPSYAERKAARDEELEALVKTRAEVAEVFEPASAKPSSFLASRRLQ